MLASAAARCLVVADVFCIVMEVVGCVGGLLNEADAQGRHDFTSAAKPGSARDTPKLAYRRHGGYGRVQQHLCGSSV